MFCLCFTQEIKTKRNTCFTGMLAGNLRSFCKMFANVFCRVFPLKGVYPYNISYNSIPVKENSLSNLQIGDGGDKGLCLM
jgi:hypothetical protein